MRKKRVVQAGKCYHLVSRVAHRAFFFDDDEKDRFVDLLMRVEFFSCVRVLAYCCMSNHIHVFIYLDDARELSLKEGNSETATRILAILASGERSRSELASELGISSQPWLFRAYLNPLVAQGYIAQTLPRKPKSPLQRYRLLRKGKAVLS